MPSKNPKAQMKQREGIDQQVTGTDIAGKEDNLQELPSLICMITRKEISVVIKKQKLQLNKDDMTVRTQKIGEVEEALCYMDSQITKLETAKKQLRKENDELDEKAEWLENYSRTDSIQVCDLTADIEMGNLTSYMSPLFKELFNDKVLLEPEVENVY